MNLVIETECGKRMLYFEKWSEIADYLENMQKNTTTTSWWIEK